MSYQQPPGNPPPHGYGTPVPGYYQPPPPPKKKRTGWIIAGGALFLLFLRFCVGNSSPPAASTSPSTTETQTPRSRVNLPWPSSVPPPSPTAQPEREPQTRATTTADDDHDHLLWVTKGGGYVGAATKEKLDQVMELVASGDKAAFEKLLARDPNVFLIKPGLRVIVVDTPGVLSGQVKLRARGELVEFWTVREAIEKP